MGVKLNKKLVGAVLLSLSQIAYPANLILEGDYIKIGINESTGTLGSGGNTSPGILYDTSGTRTFNTSYDYLTPGTPYEGWSIYYTLDGGSEVRVHNNNAYTVDLAGGVLTDYSGVDYGTLTFDNRVIWFNDSHSEFDITHDYRFNNTQQFVDIRTAIDAKVDMFDVYFGRFTDPDARAAAGDSSSTDNVLGYGVIPTTQVVFSEALVSRYALGLYSADSNVNAGITSPWSSYGDVYYQGTTPYGDGVVYGRGDHAIGLGWYIPELAIGETATFSYAYIFGPSAFAAADTAVEEGAGGGTPGEVPGCTESCDEGVVDVGSATEAAESSSGPTVVSTSTDTLLSSVTISSTPVLTYSQTNTSSVSGIRLAVNRVDTTTSTRDNETTTTSTPVTYKTWSDSTTTTELGTPTVTTSESQTIASTDALSSASAPIDSLANAIQMNFLAQQLYLTDPLDRITINGGSIEKRSGVTLTTDKDTWAWMNLSKVNGDMSGTGFDLGVERRADYDLMGGFQVGNSHNSMNSVERGSSKFNTTFAQVYLYKKLDEWTVRPSIGASWTNYDINRSIPEYGYTNSFSPNANSQWIDLQVFAPTMADVFTPYVGATLNHWSIDGGIEKGSDQTRLSWKSQSETDINPYIGARFDNQNDVTKGFFYSTDVRLTKIDGTVNTQATLDGMTYAVDSKDIGNTLTTVDAKVGYKFTDNGQVWVGAKYQDTKEYDNTILNIGVKFEF